MSEREVLTIWVDKVLWCEKDVWKGCWERCEWVDSEEVGFRCWSEY